jgi:hypothetical protein
MKHDRNELAQILSQLDLGSSVAEQDTLLQAARVETSVFTDLLNDRVDLIPGTKGSGKSALYRIFVDFLPDYLLGERKVVIAHGVRAEGDDVFHAFKDQFEKLKEQDFINFWCIYLVSLAHEQFIKENKYKEYLRNASKEIEAFRRSCQLAKIPEIKARKSLREVLEWVLQAIPWPRPTVKIDKEGSYEIDLFGNRVEPQEPAKPSELESLPRYVNQVKDDLEAILTKTNLYLWLMVDRLDEIFPRRTEMETRALRGLLRTLQIFQSPHLRVKIFLRDDILGQVTTGGEGFTALTHITARGSDPMRWSEEQILTLIVNRLFASEPLRIYLKVDKDKLKTNKNYQQQAFDLVFPPTVHPGSRQSKTLRWIYTHTMDGNGVVTPRDVIDLLTRAKQKQQDELQASRNGPFEWVIGPSAILYGLAELSKRKRDTYLRAEFPLFWPKIELFAKGKTKYSEAALKTLLGKDWHKIVDDLLSIGFFQDGEQKGTRILEIPFVFRDGLELTRGKAE